MKNNGDQLKLMHSKNLNSDEESIKKIPEESSHLQWLNIDSFPDFTQKPAQSVDQKSKNDSKDINEDYIEFDHDLFKHKFEIPVKKIRKYKGDLTKLFVKARNLKRKALVELSHGKPIIINKFDIYKLTFQIDLRGEYLLSKTNIPKIKYKKIKDATILGNIDMPECFVLADRYFSNPICVKPMQVKSIDNQFVFTWKIIIPALDNNLLFNQTSNNQGVGSEVMAKIADLNKKVNENPSDINSWLELVELQREKLGLNCSDKILAECQMAVLSKAITRNPKSEDLLLRELYITHNVSDSNSLREALDKIVFNFPNKITFWLMYFEYNQADFSHLSASNILGLYTKALLKINSLKSSNVRPSHQLLEPLGSQYQLRIYLTLARYLLGTDNFEKLIALFQILLEYNLAQTIDTELEKMKPDACLLYLETFWDSETMKIGEKGALGFSHFFSKNKKPNQASIFSSERISVFNDILVDIVPDENFYTDIEANIVRNINGVDTGWLAIETYRSSYQMLPLKTNQDVDDNERIILFDDVSSFVFKLDKCVHFELCLLFLLLLGVPIPHKLVPILNQDLADGLIISDFVLQFPQLLSQFETILGGYNLYMRKVLSPIWLHFGCDNPTSTVPIDISCLKFIRNLFVQLLSLTNFNNVQRQSLSIIWLQFEVLIALTSPSNENRNFEKVLNLSKKLLELEENRNYPAIWILYSFCLIYYGETKQYIQTMLKLIKFYNSLPSNTENNEIKGILIRFLVENVFLNDLFDTMDKNQAIDLIRSHIEKILKINYTSPLDINKSIIQMMSNINETNLMQFSNIIICQFLHTLLCFNPNIAISNFIKWIEYCSKRCQIEDSLSIDLKSYSYLTIKYDVKSSFYLLCRLISEHFSLIVCHPRMYSHIDHCKLNEIIHVCICMFPLSISLHQWFYRYNQTVSMANSFRLYFDHAQVSFLETTSIPQLSCWIFHIYTEISYLLRIIKPQEQNCNMLIKNSSSANRLRSLFEKVCSHPSYRFRPLIWRLYMRTLKILNDDEAVKSVFYRALQHTPWCKEIYQDALYFGVLISQSIVDMIIEKGIRLRLPLEELELLSTQ